METKAKVVKQLEPQTKACQCEHGDCVHPKKDGPCTWWANTTVKFEGSGTFDLCGACVATYIRDGFYFID